MKPKMNLSGYPPQEGRSLWHSSFDLCADLLHLTAKKLNPVWPGGMDYVKINVILFCIVLPLVLAASLGLNLAFLLGVL